MGSVQCYLGSCFSGRLKGTGDKAKFLAKCFYFHGQYDSQDSFASLDKKLTEKEQATKLSTINRVSSGKFIFVHLFLDFQDILFSHPTFSVCSCSQVNKICMSV